MADRLVYLNGEFVPESEANVSIFDSAMMFGDMVFEMTRTFNGKPFKLRAHLERIFASLRLLEIDCGMTIDELEQATLETLERNRPTEPDDVDWQIMHDISRGILSAYAPAMAGGDRPTVTINTWPMLTHLGPMVDYYETGAEGAIVAQQALPAHLMDMKAKTRSRMHYMLAMLQANRIGKGIFGVLTDADGYLAEGPGWNIFLVRNGVLYTPEPRNILLGVSRATAIELAAELGIELREVNLGRYEALMADEMFATSTIFNILPITKFEGQTVGEGRPGPVYQQIYDAWTKMVGVDFAQQARDFAQRLPAWLEKEREALKSAVPG